MENNKENLNNKSPWWRDGVIIFTKVSAYITVPVIAASYLGKFLDEKYSSGKLYFYISIATAFAITIYLIWLEMKKYKKRIEKENKNN